MQIDNCVLESDFDFTLNGVLGERPFSDQFFLNFSGCRGILKPYPNFCIPGGLARHAFGMWLRLDEPLPWTGFSGVFG